MHLPVALAGHRIPWTFHATAAFWDWASVRPWASDRSFVMLKTNGPAASQALVDALPAAIFGADRGASRLHFYSLAPDLLQKDVLASIGDAVGLPACDRPREFAARLASTLDTYRVILIGQATLEARSIAVLSELLDNLSKLPKPVPITVVLVAHRDNTDGAPLVFDFRTGAPLEAALSSLGAPEATRWSAYLHHRLAWEVAGNLERAMFLASLPEMRTLATRVGDDALLERLLGIWADTQFGELGVSVSKQWTDYAMGRIALPAIDTGRWRPESSDEMRPEPWLARTLLRHHAQGVQRWQLRSCLVCRPLATSVLGRCLELESRLLVTHGRDLIGTDPSEESQAPTLFARFKAGESPLLAYPDDHPAPPCLPEDVWLFATMGELVRSLPFQQNRSVFKRYWNTVTLRNGVAHGNYIGWLQWNALCQLSGLR